jgi:arylsulfatase A
VNIRLPFDLRTAAAVLATAAALPAAAQPNVIVFFVDDMGYADWEHHPVLNPTGSFVYETPNMLRLASEGVTFFNNYASGPVCSPSRVSLFTGKSVAKHNTSDFIGAGNNASGNNVRSANGWPQNVSQSDILLSEALQDAGYATGTFGKWHMGQTGNPAVDPLLNGFDVNIAGVSSGNPGFAGGFFAGNDGAWSGMPGLSTPGVFAPSDYLSDAISIEAASFISDNAANAQPFFVYVPHYVVHTPIEAPANLVSFYQAKINSLSPAQIAGHTDAEYAAMVQKMDESLGRLLDTLEDPDGNLATDDSVRDNTIIIFTADNGGLTNFNITSNRPLRAGKGSVYEGGIREPLIISYTGNDNLPQNAVLADALAIGHDIYPTILDWTGVPGDPTQNADMDGISLVPVMEGGEETKRDLIFHYPHRSPQAVSPNPIDGGDWLSAIRRGDHKLLYFYDDRRFELYNLANDIGETNNLFDPTDPVAQSLSETLYQELRAADAFFPRDIGTELPVPGPAIASDTFVIPDNAFLTSDFTDNQSFLAGAVGTSGFDAVLNPSTAAIFDQNITNPGALTFRNAGQTRIVAGDIAAPTAYKLITGDFTATMQIDSMESVNFHVLAMLIADPADPDNDFIWVGQQDRTGDNDFAQARNIVDGARIADLGENGVFPFYRVTRTANSFVGFISNDGNVWVPFVEFDRPDLPETLLVGVSQSLFSATPATATVASFQIASTCPLDIAEPIGSLDSADVLRFVEALELQEPIADLATPFGSFDFFDLLRYLELFDAGCP